MVTRDDMSEALLAAMSTFTFLVLFVCPGWLFLWALPAWIGLPLAICSGLCGPALLWHVDLELYGPRDSDGSPKGGDACGSVHDSAGRETASPKPAPETPNAD